LAVIKRRVRVTAPNWPQFEQKGISPEVTRALANLHAELVMATLEETDERAYVYSIFGKGVLELTDAVDEMLKNAK
jgi:hypothetical protein